jgi:hypothetical protein
MGCVVPFVFVCGASTEQIYPTKSVRVVHGFASGSPIDTANGLPRSRCGKSRATFGRAMSAKVPSTDAQRVAQNAPCRIRGFLSARR